MAATLTNLIENENGLRVFCNACSRCAVMDVGRLLKRYGGDLELPAIGKRAVCRGCGAKGGSVQVVAVDW